MLRRTPSPPVAGIILLCSKNKNLPLPVGAINDPHMASSITIYYYNIYNIPSKKKIKIDLIEATRLRLLFYSEAGFNPSWRT